MGALTIAVIVVSELRQAKSLDNSLIAHFGAESGLEQSLYDVRKLNHCLTEDCSNTNAGYADVALPGGTSVVCNLGTVGCSSQSYQRRIAPPLQQHIPSLKENDTFSLELSSGTNPIQQLEVLWRPTDPTVDPQFLPFLEVSYVVTQGVATYVCRPTIAPLLSVPYRCNISNEEDCRYPAADSPPLVFDFFNLSETDCASGSIVQQVRFKALNAGVAALTLNVLPVGTGLSNYIEVKSRRTTGGATQNLQTTIPKQVSAYGFTDYVVFSEQDIVK